MMYFNERAGEEGRRRPDEDARHLGRRARARGQDQGAARPDVAGLAYNIHDWPDDWLLRGMILQGGGNMLDDGERKVAFGGESGCKALTYLRRFVTEGGMPLIDWDQSRQQFIAGQIGIFFDTPARMRQVTDLIGDKFTLRTAIFPIDDKAKGGAADRRQRGDRHRQGRRPSRRRPGSSSSS